MIHKNKENMENEQEYNQIPPKDIFAYNELRSCADLHRLYKDGILDIQPEFQRNEVWPPAFQARFIDSLVKELPIPNMCFSYDKDQNQMRVIDGLQRMTSIIKFLDTEKEWKISVLPDIDPRISGKTNFQIKKDSVALYDSIRNLSLPVTFLRVSHKKIEHDEYLFSIFHRLNTYGKRLNSQEIRNCIYSGPFNSLIKELNETSDWKKLLNIKHDNRFQKTELILRFFAFYDELKNYDGILTKFLNRYMSIHRNDTETELSIKKTIFLDTIDLVFDKITDKKVLNKTSNAFVESLLFGVAKNLQFLKKNNGKDMKNYYKKMSAEKVFSEKNLSEGVMKKNKVDSRFQKTLSIFSGK
mgnify:CR=1 FL=1